MNILKNTVKNKQNYISDDFASNTSLNKISTDYRKDKDFLRKCRYQPFNSTNISNDNNVINQTLFPKVESFKLALRDDFSPDQFVKVVKGNTLVIAESRSEALDRSLVFQKIYSEQGFLTRLISFRQFLSWSHEEQTRPDISYILRLNAQDDINISPQDYSNCFSNIFVFGRDYITQSGAFNTKIYYRIKKR